MHPPRGSCSSAVEWDLANDREGRADWYRGVEPAISPVLGSLGCGPGFALCLWKHALWSWNLQGRLLVSRELTHPQLELVLKAPI